MRVVRPFANRIFNPIVRPFIAWVPGFALVVHRGRRSGRVYRTPMMAFRSGENEVFALTYGRDVDWVRNVLAAGWCELIVRRGRVRLVDPQVVTDPSRRVVPALVRLPLRALRVADFLVMRRG